jgi:hypothetical protein
LNTDASLENLGATVDHDSITNDESTILGDSRTFPQKCNFQEKVVSQKYFKATFKGLNSEEDYFPMVCRADSRAFFGLPPPSVRPKAQDTALPTRSASWENNQTPRFGIPTSNYRRPFVTDEEDDEDLVEADYDNHSNIYEASPARQARRQARSETPGRRFQTPTSTPNKYQIGFPPVNRTLLVKLNPTLLMIDDCA